MVEFEADDALASAAAWEARLKSYEWVDAAAGKVSIPIVQAEKMVVAEYAKGAK